MNKRNIIKLISVGALTIALSGFKLPSLGGGGGGGADWKTIASDFNGSFKKINAGLLLVLEGINESNDAIGIKETKAAQSITDDAKANGSKINFDISERSLKVIEDFPSKMAKNLENRNLTADEKAALAKASKKFFGGAINAVPGYIQFFATFQKAQKAGTPKPMDLVGAAKDIPEIISNAPAMFEMIPTTFSAIAAYRKSLEDAKIPLPAEAKGLEKAKGNLPSF
jgi:hypothetical protein